MLDLLTDVLKRAKERGATAADAFLVEDRAFSAQVRLGRVDTVKHAREQHLSLTSLVPRWSGWWTRRFRSPASLLPTS
jgi:predicted Zn-dependent protease